MWREQPTGATSYLIVEGHSAHVLWKEQDLEQQSEIKFSIDIDEYFLTIRSTMLFYRFPNKKFIFKTKWGNAISYTKK